MKKLFSNLGYKYTDKDDLSEKEFRHVNTSVTIDEETTTLNNIRDLVEAEYELSLKKYDVSLFTKKLRELFDASRSLSSKDVFDADYDNGKSYYVDNYSVTSTLEEDRTLLNIIFTIRGE